MFGYRRIFPRLRYETVLVEALVACGYQILLSTDHEDEKQGIDVWDTEYAIPWDLYIGETNSPRYAQKLATAASKGVAILRIPSLLVEDLCLYRNNPNRLKETLLKLDGIYDRSLAAAEGNTYRTRAQAQQIELRWLREHTRQAA
jgi:hypothetical protein